MSMKKILMSLTSDTQVEMMKLSSEAMTILREKLNADGFNFGANFGEVAGAGIKEHVHLHIVPSVDWRYQFYAGDGSYQSNDRWAKRN